MYGERESRERIERAYGGNNGRRRRAVAREEDGGGGGEREPAVEDVPINDAHALTPARAFTILFIIYAKLCGASPWIP